MNRSTFKLTSILREHALAILISILIGTIFLLPYLLIPLLQEENQHYSPLVVKGVDARNVDEALYAAYVQEVAEGHIIPRSNIAEWKDQQVLSHAGAPFPSLILGTLSVIVGGVVNTYIVSYFIFTAVSSLLIYILLYLFTKNKTISLIAAPLLFFSPTYFIKFFSDNITQPISYFSRFYPALVDFPIFALTLLFVYLLLKRNQWKFAAASGILGGLLFYTYFYYWTFYLVFIGLLWLLFVKRRERLYKISFSIGITTALAATFFYTSWKVVQMQPEILSRIGATFTNDPDWISAVFLSMVISALVFTWKKSSRKSDDDKNPLLFLTALLLAGIVSMNIQVIIGYTINPRHWLTTVIWPALILTGIYILHHLLSFITNKIQIISSRATSRIISIISGIVIVGLLFFGLIWQVVYAQNTYQAYTLSDSQQELFRWLAVTTQKDEVVLSLQAEMILLVPIYTHNNNYLPNANVEPIPISEMVSRRLIAYKLLEVPEEKIIFLENPCAFGKLLKDFESQKNGTYNNSLFEEAFSHHLTFESFFAKKGCSVPEEYKKGVFTAYQKLPTDWNILEKKYRVDYIVLGSYEKEISRRDISKHAEEVFSNTEFAVYKIRS